MKPQGSLATLYELIRYHLITYRLLFEVYRLYYSTVGIDPAHLILEKCHMTSKEPRMTEPAPDPELLLRLHRRSMVHILILIVAFGAFLIASALWPNATLLRWVEQAPWLIPMAIILFVVVQQTSLRKHRFTMDAPEFKAIIRDEWRRRSMDRATRGALIVVLVAQVPLGLLISYLPTAQLPLGRLLSDLPTLRAVMGMAVSTITLGLAAQVGLFLFFDRK